MNSNEQLFDEEYLTFNILGKIYHVKQSLLENQLDFLSTSNQFYDEKRQEYVLDISPVIFEAILEYYSTQKLIQPRNIQLDYFKATLDKLQIDTSSLTVDEWYERIVPRQSLLQLMHILLEYPDSCRLAQILHYTCSMIALLSSLLMSLSLASRDPNIDLYRGNSSERELPVRSKSIIAHFRNRSSRIFLIDLLCLIWAVGETILRTLSTPSFYHYLTNLGLFDITGVVFHSIYIYMIGIGTKPRFGLFQQGSRFIFAQLISRCRVDPIPAIDTFLCITFNRRLMMLSLFRKVRLVRYIRPLRYFILSLLKSKREITRLLVTISFLLAFLAPLIFILESSSIYQCSSTQTLPTRCIRTISDACYYLILIITTVGYGDVYPMSQLAHFISMFASLLSLMMLSVPISSIYRKYLSVREMDQVQLRMPENVRYMALDSREFIQGDKQEMIDVTKRVNGRLKYLGISQSVQEELDRRNNPSEDHFE